MSDGQTLKLNLDDVAKITHAIDIDLGAGPGWQAISGFHYDTETQELFVPRELQDAVARAMTAANVQGS